MARTTLSPADLQGAVFGRFKSAINPWLGDLLARIKLDTSFVGGQGLYLHDDRGRRILDFVAGYGALPFGHNPPAILDALQRSLKTDMPTMVQPMMPDSAGMLAEMLLDLAPCAFNRVSFANSGAEAVEIALKACRMATGRDRIIAMEQGFHGKTMGAMSVTDMRGRRNWQGPQASLQTFIPFGNLDALADELSRSGADTAAVIIELVQGEGGIHVAPDGFAAAVRTLCDKHGALLIVDEVQTGLGRTGELFATGKTGIEPDCIAIAKGLGGGVLPIGACLIGDRADSSTLGLQHSSTFAGNSLACTVGLATLDLLLADNRALLTNVRERSDQLDALHAGFCDRFPDVVAEHRGVGLLRGLQLRAPARGRSWGRTLEVLSDQGLLCVLLASNLLNNHGVRVAPTLRAADVLRVEPPLTVTAEACSQYAEAMTALLAQVASGDTASLSRHLVSDGGSAATQPSRPAAAAEPRRFATPAAQEGHFAFLVHPLDSAGFADFDEALRSMEGPELAKLGTSVVELTEPFHVARTRFSGAGGKSAIGDFIVVPRTAGMLAAMERPQSVAIVQQAVDIAVGMGARLVGLGGFTSIVANGGTAIDGRGAGLTTGNSFTVVAAMQAIEQATTRMGLTLPASTGGVVGATGLIGGAAIALLGARCGRLVLLSNSETSAAKTARRLKGHLVNALQAWIGGTVVPERGSMAEALLADRRCPRAAMPEAFAGVDIDEAVDAYATILMQSRNGPRLEFSIDGRDLARCSVAVVATSSTNAFIQPDMLRPGAVICDLSRPANISRDVALHRADVLLIDGGTIEFPGRVDMGFNFGLPRGIGYACMAETTMLALEKSYGNASYGARLSLAECGRIKTLAEHHSFRLSGLRSMDRPLDRVEWRNLLCAPRENVLLPPGRTVRPLPSAAEKQEARVGEPAAEGSVGPGDEVSLYTMMVTRHLEAGRGDIAAVIDSNGTTTYAELHRQSSRYAATLSEAGFGLGARIVLCGDDSARTVAAILAAWRIGASVSVMNVALNAETVASMCSDCDAAVVIDCGIPASASASLESAIAALAVPLLNVDRLGEGVAPVPPVRSFSTESIALCLFTSGSTGSPKAVEHCVGDLVNINLNYAAKVLGLSTDDRIATTSRLFFAYGINIMQMALWAGAALSLAGPQFDPDEVLHRLEIERPTILFAVPTVYLLMLKKARRLYTLESLRLCISAGEPLPVDIYDDWQEKYGHLIIDGIGTSEVLSTFISNVPGDERAGSTGRVVPGFEVRLAAEDGHDVAIGEIGRLWVRGNTVASGYLNSSPETINLFSEGWSCTNDLMYLDEQKRFYYVGRGNDMFKVGGIWASPLEIEAVIREHPAVLECAVVARPEIGMLARLEAFVVMHEQMPTDDSLALEIRQHAKERLSSGRAPHFISFVAALPKTATQKVQRFRLRERSESTAHEDMVRPV
jgi:acetylornithine/succinyldiaminopimelate/putrescine aminotransferase/acyl-coenzyme A synthetase/AMP-(fatty) acid ligase/predicted amino acid dehydrogenase